MSGRDLEALLAEVETFDDDPELRVVAKAAFEFAEFLLDSDDNLTKTGNLNGEAKQRLRDRLSEALDGLDDSEVES